MRWKLLLVSLLAPAVASAASLQSVDSAPVCDAAANEGALAVEIERMAEQGTLPADRAEILALECSAGKTLLDVLIEGMQAENLEYAVIDLGVDVNQPLLQEAGGKLTVMQYLLRQAGIASDPQVRAFAIDYMKELGDVDFNPNQLLVSLD